MVDTEPYNGPVHLDERCYRCLRKHNECSCHNLNTNYDHIGTELGTGLCMRYPTCITWTETVTSTNT